MIHTSSAYEPLDICDLSNALDALRTMPAVAGVVATSVALSITGCAVTVTARAARDRIREVAWQVPIRLGDTMVSPGDYRGRPQGCVVVQAARIPDVLTRAEAILARAGIAIALDRGPVSKVMGGKYDLMLERGDDKRRPG